MAHHLIALLFSSAQYTTSPSMKPTHPVHHHTTAILFSYLSPFRAPLLSIPVQLSSSLHFSFPLLPYLVQLPLSLFFSMFASILISVSVWFFPLLLWSPPAHPHVSSLAGSLFRADVPLVSGGLAGRQQKWLWDWGMAALLSLTHRAILMSLQLHTYRVDSGVRKQGGEMK